VPLDWTDESVGTTKVAFVKYPSKNESAEDLVLNFGGPGGSGVATLLNISPLLANVFGSSVNLISFDPRGVNNTGPALDCFSNDPATKAIFESQYYRIIADTPDNIATQFYLAESFGRWCNPVIGGPNGTARYVNTPAVARDMLAFAELAHATRGKPKADAKLWFAGFSYGGVLGTTFAALFPDRIGRFILDGVVDGEDYYGGSWSKSLIDTDKVVDGLISSCLAAGGEACPLYEDSFEAIEYRLSNILTKLKQHPIPVWDPAIVDVPALATYADWSNVLLLATNFPLASYPKIVQILIHLEQGRGESLIASKKMVLGANYSKEASYNSVQGYTMIGCVDAGGRHNLSSLDNFRDYASFLKTQSKYTGEAWAVTSATCRVLDVIPPTSGQFTGQLPPSANKTSSPILFIGNRADPVTPLVGTRRASTSFPGSGLVEIDGIGHTSLGVPSTCAFKEMRKYLSGASPLPLVSCKPDEVPFQSKLEGLALLTEI
ncbi:unnamed protein product, partial [Clonostachys byssicola]